MLTITSNEAKFIEKAISYDSVDKARAETGLTLYDVSSLLARLTYATDRSDELISFRNREMQGAERRKYIELKKKEDSNTQRNMETLKRQTTVVPRKKIRKK